MKKTVLFFLMIILIASCHQEEIPSVSDKPEGNQLIFDLSDEDARQGCIYVKLKEEPTEEVQIRSIGNTVRTGIKVLDRAASSLKIERMERTFPYAGKFEERSHHPADRVGERHTQLPGRHHIGRQVAQRRRQKHCQFFRQSCRAHAAEDQISGHPAGHTH